MQRSINQYKLYLISSPLEGQPVGAALPIDVIDIICSLDYFLVENAKTARAFLRTLPLKRKLQDIELHEFSNDSHSEQLLKLLKVGKDIGVLSETGSPCIADPGVNLIDLASRLNLEICPLVGPSAVMSAIMASGLNGQNFAFNGYLPVKSPDLENRIRELEKLARKTLQAQFFMETPYRVEKLFNKIVSICQADTLLSLAVDIGSEKQFCYTRAISDWRGSDYGIGGRLCIIGIGYK